MSKDTRICSFDITNMYTNIPKAESTNITANILKRNLNTGDNNQKEIIDMLQTMTEQNYFQFEQKFYKQTDGLAMGAPTLAITSEADIQNMGHKQIFSILVKHQIAGYFRYSYVDILIIYDQAKTNIDQTLANFNKQPTNHKIHNRKRITQLINFLDLTIHCNEKEFEFEIRVYSMPTQTDIIIPHDSCHLREHKT
jgi:hypothetical protein